MPIKIKIKRQKFGFGLYIIMFIFGGMFFISGLLPLLGTYIHRSWIRVNGSVADMSIMTSDGSMLYSPIIQYHVNNNTYRVRSNISNSTKPEIGTKVPVAYNPSNPSDAKVVNSYTDFSFILLFPLVGASIMIGSSIAYLKSRKRDQIIEKLVREGRKIQGILTNIKADNRNNYNTYRFVVSAKNEQGTVQDYISDEIWGIASLALADFKAKPVMLDVFIDFHNPENYYVDVSKIPEIVAERTKELVNSSI